MTQLDFRAVLDAFADAVVAADRAGRIVYANAAADRLLGWPAGELTGQPLTVLIPPRLHAAHRAGFARYLDSGVSTLIGRPARVPALRRDGTELDVELVLTVLRRGRAGELFLAVLRDLRERVELERQLEVGRHLRAVTRTAARLAADADLDRALATVAETVVAEFDAAAARIWLYEASAGTLHLRASAGLPVAGADGAEACVPVATSPLAIAEVARTGSPVVRSGLAASGRPGRRGPAGEAEVAALAAFPLLVAGELRGVLAGFFRRPLEEGTADLLATFAALVTPALVAATERRFHDLVEGLDAIVWEADAATFRFTFVSRQAEAILGYPVAQWLTEPDFWVKHLHPDDRARAVAFCLEATEAGRNHELEYRAIAADGRVVWLRDIVRIVSGPDGRPRQLRGVMIDITEQRRAEAALREREEHLRLVVRATDDAVWVWDLRTDEVTWNEALERLFGYPPAEVLPRVEWWYERIHPDDRERVLSGIHDLLEQGGDSWAAEHRFRRADGGYATVIDRGYVVRDQDGRPLRMIGAMVDITRRVQLEEQLRQSQKMEAIGRLAGGIAHDFNNILTAITGYSELLLGRLEEGDPLRRHALEIHRAAERAASLTRQLLAFSRRQVLRPTVVDLNAVVSNMDGMLRRLIGEDIELRTLPAADLGWVRADTGQLEQAILNLAVNARDAMPQGGKLTIETANVELDEAYAQRHAPVVPGRYVLLAVSDTGCGMDPETRARIFEPFFTTKERGKGTGLGLATVYGIVKQSGGYIWVYSEPGHGSTFKIYLPRVEAAPAPLPPPPARPPAPGRETVLLVEDEDAVRTLARQVLEQHGYRVLEAAGAADALALVEWHRGSIDLLLTDVVMPGMSGRELAERFAAARGAVKVLYMSGYTDSAIVHHGILDPGTAFLQKPFSPAALAGKVRDVLDAP